MATALPNVAIVNSASAVEADLKNHLQALNNFLTAILGATGEQSDALTALAAPLNKKTAKSGAYTVVAADRGKVIDCTGTFTLSLTAAATLGDGFVFAVQNSGSGTITIDPASAETIDGAATKSVAAGKLFLIYCDGTKFLSIGGGTTSADVIAALGYTPSPNTHNHTGVYVPINAGFGGLGSYVIGTVGSGYGSVSNGGTKAGSQIQAMSCTISSPAWSTGAVLGGTWRNVSGVTIYNEDRVGLWQRIA